MRKAKIICTIGPASESPAVLDRLVASGMDAARLNFSHGSRDWHGRTVKAIREAAGRRGAAVAIIQDLQGPRIRLGALPPAGVELRPDQRVRLRPEPDLGAAPAGPDDLPVGYARLARDLAPGARVLIDDGLVELVAERIADGAVECRVVRGGRVTSHKGLNLPGTRISEPTLTEKDRDDLRFGVAQGVDYLALSFVRSPEDVAAARKLIADCGGDQPIIAKIERPEALACLEALLDEADGVMIARGDLGVELSPEEVPVLQKQIIAAANRRRRLVITATQMLESMTQQARPTRAEASDVANAVFDGTDAVMLSAETASGRYPVEALQVMDRIVREAERGAEPGVVRLRQPERGPLSFQEAICAAAPSVASMVRAAAIVAFSESGATARLIGKHRPAAPIIAFTPFEPVRRRMALYWGVRPLTMPPVAQTDDRVREAERRLTTEGLAASGDKLAIVTGAQASHPGGTTLLKLHAVA